MKKIRTIWHSNHHILDFLELLEKYEINCIVDVRSSPYSSYTPQYNKEALRVSLKKINIIYVSLNKEFGARHDNPIILDSEWIVDFEKVQAQDFFRQWIKRLDTAIEKEYRLALMCSEAEPLDCHRFSMITTYLQKHEWYTIDHIVVKKWENRIESNDELEERMLKKYKLEASMFEAKHEIIQRAYIRRNKEIGYKPQF